jgi:chitinase
VYLAPDVYSGTPAQCTAPCLFVLPPRALPAPTTISISPYITSLELGPGTTSTITVTVPAITTGSMDYYNYQISSGQATTGYTFTPTASLSIPPITTTLKLPDGTTQVRTLHLPPWPAITNPSGALTTVTGKPPSSTTDPAGTSGIGGFIGWPDFSNAPPAPPEPTVDLPVKPAYTPKPNSPTTLIPGSTPTWPVFEIIPVQSDVPDGGQDDDGDGPKSKSTCKLWFFFICVKWDDFNIKIGGWEWNMPVGIWGPGPPPIANIKLPPGFTLKGTLPRWPKITVLPGGKIVPPTQPADCTPAQASLCYTTSSFATTVSKGTTKTTATQVKSTCATITGCNFKDVEATKSVDACKLARRTAASVVEDAPPKSTGIADPRVEKRATNKPEWAESGATTGAFLIPRSPLSLQERQAIEALLAERDTDLICKGKPHGYTEVYAKGPKWTAYWRVENVGADVLSWFDSPEFPEVRLCPPSAPECCT